MGNRLKQPIIRALPYSLSKLNTLQKDTKGSQAYTYLFEYPTVYLIIDRGPKNQYQIYVGETNDIQQRTRQHLLDDPNQRQDFKALSDSEHTKMIVISHDHFNKSLTLDIENKMMLYLSGVECVSKLNNRRENEQNKYYTAELRDQIFSKIWRHLEKVDQALFPVERIIRDSALFKVSPFHRLTDEQAVARNTILAKIKAALLTDPQHQLILVQGEAGSGKTVLLSTILYRLCQQAPSQKAEAPAALKVKLIINHAQQLTVYKDIAKKLGIMDKYHETVMTSTRFINQTPLDEPVDVALVDESHLLLTRGKQSYRGTNQLADIRARAKVTVAIFDPKQVLKTEQYIETDALQSIQQQAQESGNLILLHHQLRIAASDQTIAWIRGLTDGQTIGALPKDRLGYDLKFFDDPVALYQAICQKNKDHQNAGLSRLLATFDWPYSSKQHQDMADPYWMVSVGALKLPWNLQLPTERSQKDLAWAQQDQTINEVGSTYTIQGFDLNYCGVIIGPSVKYRDGKIVFDSSQSCDHNVTSKRTLADGKKVYIADQLIANELNVLLTRGVHGLYIYAVDPPLRAKLRSLQP